MRRLFGGFAGFRLARLGQVLVIALTIAGLTGISAGGAGASTGTLSVSTAANSYAVLGQSYFQAVTISGGTTPYYVESFNGLPEGLTMPVDPSGDQANITGTPQLSGVFNFTITVIDSSNPQQTASVNATIDVRVPSTIGSTFSGTPVTGQPVTVTTQVTSVDYANNEAATGTMTFEDASGTPISGCDAVKLNGNAQASCTLPGAAAGTQDVKLVYSGDSNYAPAVTATTYQVQPDATTTTYIADDTTAIATVTADSPGVGAPTGNVTFSDASGTLGVGTLSGGNPDTASITYAKPLPAGSSTEITATYGGDTNFLGSSYGPYDLVIPPLAISPSTLPNATDQTAYSQQLSAAGGYGTYSYQVAPGSSPPPGLTLSSSGLLSGTPKQAGSFSFPVDASDTNGGTGTQEYTLNVLARPTISLTTSPSSLVTGEPLTLDAQVTSPDTSAIATGTVSFAQGGTAMFGCSAVPLDSSGIATCPLPGAGAGSNLVTLTYSGSNTYAPGASTPSFTVNPDATTTLLTTTSTTLTATISPNSPGGGVAVGTVTFYEGTTKLGSEPTPDAKPDTVTYTLPTPLPAGSTTAFKAVYGGSSDYLGSEGSATEVVPPLVITPTGLANATDWSPYSAQLAAAGGAGSPAYGFMVSSGALPNGVTLSPTGLISGTPTQSGAFTFVVKASDQGGDVGTHQYTLDVVLPTLTSVLSLGSGPGTAVSGQQVTLTATLTDPNAHFTPTGTVTFEQPGGTALSGCANVPLSSATASCTISSATAGTHGVTAVYSGDAVYSRISTSGSYAVGQAQSSIALSVGSGSLSATVKAVAPGTGTPSGTISFLVGGRSVGVASLSAGTATISYALPAGQSVQVSAVYSGDSNFTGSSTAMTAAGAGVTPSLIAQPSITARVVRPARRNRYGWYSQPVRIRFVCATHGAKLVAPCPAEVTLRRNGGGQSVTRTIRTTSGGVATVSLRHVNIDLRAPSVKLVGLRSGEIYSAAPTPHCAATDRVSGVASCRMAVVRHSSNRGVGLTTLRYTATATNRAGRRSSVSVTVKQLGIYLVGARYVNGRFLVQAGRSYEIRVSSAGQPRYIDASPSPSSAAGRDKFFVKVGERSWLQLVTLPGDLFARFGSWDLGVEIDGKLHQIPVAPAKE